MQIKVLVTGGDGFFGSRFALRHQSRFQVFCPSRQEFNVVDADAVSDIVARIRPDLVIHAAALTKTDICNENPNLARLVNVQGALNVAQACDQVDSRLIFLSTEQVFNGNSESGPYGEDVSPMPDTVYGLTKLEAEHCLSHMLEKLWIVRLSWMFGMPEKACGMSDNLLWSTIVSLMKNEPISASPHEFRSVTYIEDMLEIIIRVFEIPYGLYHLAAPNNLSRYELVRHIVAELGLSDRAETLLVCDRDKYKDHPRDVRLATHKAATLGLHFDESLASLSRCITDYGLKNM